jgi:glutathione S-transferase
MDWVAIVVLLALLECYAFGILVGRARGRYNVPAPAIAGHPIFERYMRVHQNTLEQLVVFVPAIWIFGHYLSPRLAAGLGLVFLIGRLVYFRGYVEEPEKRAPGALLSALAILVLVLGALFGAIRALAS